MPALQARGPVLDIGCGDGLFFGRLQEFGDVRGVEADPSLVDPTGPFAGQIFVGPFDERYRPGVRFRLIVMLDVLEHLPDPASALRQVRELLDDEGVLVITVPAFRLCWTAHDEWNHHYTRYTKATLSPLLESAGLEIDQLRYFFLWTFPAKLLVRAKETLFRSVPAPAQVPSLALNQALYRLSRGEQATLGRLNLPWGTSLLAVARRGSTERSAVATPASQQVAVT